MQSFGIQLQKKIHQHLTSKTTWNKSYKFWNSLNSLFRDVFGTVVACQQRVDVRKIGLLTFVSQNASEMA